MILTLKDIPPLLVSTYSLIGLRLNTKSYSVAGSLLQMTEMRPIWMKPTFKTALIGEHRALSLPSRIKDSADHAGHSLQLVPLKVSIRLLVRR